MKNVRASCAAAFAVALAIAAGVTSPVLAQATAVRVAVHNIPPFGGDPAAGLCFDVLEAIAERQGLELQYQPMGIGDIFPALIAGTADLGCSGNGPTASFRRDGYAFTGAIASNREILLVRSGDTRTYATLADLRGLKVGTVAPYLPLATNAGLTDLVTLPGFPDGIAALRAGEIDVYLTGETVWRYQSEVLGAAEDVRRLESYVSVSVNYPAIATRADDADLLGRVQAGLEGIKADGTLSTILELWGLPAPPF